MIRYHKCWCSSFCYSWLTLRQLLLASIWLVIVFYS